jgi:hypothetical protein
MKLRHEMLAKVNRIVIKLGTGLAALGFRQRPSWLGLVLVGLMTGCAAQQRSATTKVFDYSSNGDAPVSEGAVLTGLGNSFSLRAAADSWPALVKKVKPTFAWNGCDMMWIKQDERGQPQFVMDEAYIYQPTNQPRQWVLVGEERPQETHVASFDEEQLERQWRLQFSGYNLHAIAKLYASIPMSDIEDGIIRGFAVVKSTHAQLGTVYEIGWQRVISSGSGHREYNRRLYVLKDAANQWHFLGEGPEVGGGKGGCCESDSADCESRVIWKRWKTNELPLKINFIIRDEDDKWNWNDEHDPGRSLVTYSEAVLEGRFPAQLRRTTEHPYVLARKGDTLDGIVGDLASFTLGWDNANMEERHGILKMWRDGIARLNPQLPTQASMKDGTGIHILTYQETLDEVERLKNRSTR